MESLAPSLSFAQALQAHQEHLHVLKRSVHTRDAYGRDLRQTVRFFTERLHLTGPRQVSLLHLELLLRELDRQGLSETSRRRKVAAIKSYFQFLAGQGVVSPDPSSKLIPPPQAIKTPRVLSDAECNRLKAVAQDNIRDAAMVEVLLNTGMRLAELAGLTMSDIHLPDAQNHGRIIIHGRNGKQRAIPLTEPSCQVLRHYLSLRPAMPFPHVFFSQLRQPLGVRGIENVVGKYLKLAGIEGASVHTLRHAFGMQQVKQHTSLLVVKEALGHADVRTTEQYVELAREEVNREQQGKAL